MADNPAARASARAAMSTDDTKAKDNPPWCRECDAPSKPDCWTHWKAVEPQPARSEASLTADDREQLKEFAASNGYYARLTRAALAEIDALKHDIERYVAVATEYANEEEGLRAGFDRLNQMLTDLWNFMVRENLIDEKTAEEAAPASEHESRGRLNIVEVAERVMLRLKAELRSRG